MLTMCGACAGSPIAKQAVQLPAAASVLRPVDVPEPIEGESAKAALAETRAALDKANDRLAGGRAWYDGVRKRYRNAPLPN